METPKSKTAPAKEPPAATEHDDLREPTKEEILEDLRIALRDVIAGKKGIPAREGLEAMRRRIYGDAEYS